MAQTRRGGHSTPLIAEIVGVRNDVKPAGRVCGDVGEDLQREQSQQLPYYPP